MRNAFLVVAIALAIVLVLNAFGGRRDAIARAETQTARFETERDSLRTVIGRRNKDAAALTGRVQQYRGAAKTLRDSVTALERRRSAHTLRVREIRTTGALIARLRSTFAEFGDSAWGLTTVPIDDRDTIGIEYLMVPAWFAETFVIDRANAKSWRAQKDRLLQVDSLGLLVVALQDSVTRLTAANAFAYRVGYDAAYTGYQDLSRRYVAELRKPRVTLGNAIGLIAAAGAGFLLGEIVRE